MTERMVGKTFDRLFAGCEQRIIVTTFASNVHRIQQVIDAAAAVGRKVAVTGRSMENVTKRRGRSRLHEAARRTLVTDYQQDQGATRSNKHGHRHHRLAGRGDERALPHGVFPAQAD